MSEIETYKIDELNLELIQPSTDTYKNPDQGGSKIVMIGKPGCFLKDTEVLMYDGQRKMIQDIKENEIVMGWDSTERKVLELCRGVDNMFEIIPDFGEKYTVNSLHKLVILNKNTEDDITACIKNHEIKLNTNNECGCYFCEYQVWNSEIIEIEVEKFLNLPDIFRKNCKVFRNMVDFSKKDFDFQDFKITSESEHISRSILFNSFHNKICFLPLILSNFQKESKDDNVIGSRINVTNFKESLIGDILFLLRSMGFLAIQNRQDNFIEIGGDIEKIAECFASNNYSSFTNCSNFQIKCIGENNYYGFVLDGDHKFLLSSCDVVRNTGKSTLILSLLYHKKHIFPVAKIMSGTEDSNHEYSKRIPTTFVFDKYDEKEMIKFKQRQKMAKEHIENAWAYIVTDDCTEDPKILSGPTQLGFFKNGRHWKMLYILSLQYAMDIKPAIRTTIDGTFILRETIPRNRRILYENYAGIIPTFHLFNAIMDQITDDYTALYIHNASRTNNWQECVFWFRADRDLVKDFKFGCDEFWEFHYDRYNPEYVPPLN